MHEVEKELIKATEYKAQRKFSDRQDYLKSILNAVSKLENEEFDLLSDEAATWANSAVAAHNARDVDIPDFDEIGESDEGLEEEAEDVADSDPTAVEEAEDEELEARDDELPHDEPEPDDEPEEAPAPKAKKAAKSKPEPKPAKTKVKAADDDVVLDKWGAMDGSKNSRALALFEKGATTKEVKEKIGGTYYNILKKMVQNGHKMEKEGSLIKLTHIDDMKSGKAAVKSKKK